MLTFCASQDQSTGTNSCSNPAIAALCDPDQSTGCDDNNNGLGTCTCRPGFMGDLCDKFTPAPNGQCALPAATTQYKNIAPPAVCCQKDSSLANLVDVFERMYGSCFLVGRDADALDRAPGADIGRLHLQRSVHQEPHFGWRQCHRSRRPRHSHSPLPSQRVCFGRRALLTGTGIANKSYVFLQAMGPSRLAGTLHMRRQPVRQ